MSQDDHLWKRAFECSQNLRNESNIAAFTEISERICEIIGKELEGNSLRKREALQGLNGLHWLAGIPPPKIMDEIDSELRDKIEHCRVHNIKKLEMSWKTGWFDFVP